MGSAIPATSCEVLPGIHAKDMRVSFSAISYSGFSRFSAKPVRAELSVGIRARNGRGRLPSKVIVVGDSGAVGGKATVERIVSPVCAPSSPSRGVVSVA